MCGIFGFSKLTERTRLMAPFLAQSMEKRGADSYGICGLIKNEATDRYDRYLINKGIGPISAAYYGEDVIRPEYLSAICHTRAASQGKIELENAHPFLFENDNYAVIGTHNGVLSNHAELCSDRKEQFNVDSQHIWHGMLNNLPSGSIRGWGSCAGYWLDKATQHYYMVFFRFNHDALHFVWTPDESLVYASTSDALEVAHRFAYGIDPSDISIIKGDTLYALDMNCQGSGLYALTGYVFGARGGWTGRNQSNYPSQYQRQGWTSGWHDSDLNDEAGWDEWFKRTNNHDKAVAAKEKGRVYNLADDDDDDDDAYVLTDGVLTRDDGGDMDSGDEEDSPPFGSGISVQLSEVTDELKFLLMIKGKVQENISKLCTDAITLGPPTCVRCNIERVDKHQQLCKHCLTTFLTAFTAGTELGRRVNQDEHKTVCQ